MNKNNQLTIHDLKILKFILLRRMREFEMDYSDVYGVRIQSGSLEQDFLDDLQRIICKLEDQERELLFKQVLLEEK